MINADDLPKLQEKQFNCIKRYFANGFNKSEAYRYAYDCKNMKATTISVEASRFFKNPNITLWIAYMEQNQQEVLQEELKYSALDFFDECNELKMIALDCRDKYGNPNIAAAIKATENKAKVCGLLKEQTVTVGNVTQMPAITINGEEFDFKIGEDANGNTSSENS